jgi:hypothetical protein
MSWLTNLNWDNVSKTLNTVGTAATQIAQTAEVLAAKKNVASGTVTAPQTRAGSSSNNGGIVALGFLVAGIILTGRKIF